MKLALNFSQAAATLVRARAVTIDLYKCPDWPGLVYEAESQRPVYVHFPFAAGRVTPDRIDVASVEAWQARTSTRHVNTHLDPELGDEHGFFVRTEAAIARAVRDVRALVERFGAHNVVVENVPYWPGRNLHERLAARLDDDARRLARQQRRHEVGEPERALRFQEQVAPHRDAEAPRRRLANQDRVTRAGERLEDLRDVPPACHPICSARRHAARRGADTCRDALRGPHR